MSAQTPLRPDADDDVGRAEQAHEEARKLHDDLRRTVEDALKRAGAVGPLQRDQRSEIIRRARQPRKA
jgi:hypothetical protein